MIRSIRNAIMLAVLAISGCANEPSAPSAAIETDVKLNKVIVLGMIHGQHETSSRYPSALVKAVIEAINPDYVLTEIPPDLFAEAVRSFEEDGQITEPRVMRFPEYVDVLFPLTRTLEFEIIPTAGWTRQMANFRSDALDALSRDQDRREDWQAYRAAIDEMERAIGTRGDDPYFIHTEAYDAITKTGLTPYADLFANDLGVGDWETINEAHYRLIENALDQYTGEGATVMITYGAGHKYWFLEQLRLRTDIELVSPLPYFDQVTVAQE